VIAVTCIWLAGDVDSLCLNTDMKLGEDYVVMAGLLPRERSLITFGRIEIDNDDLLAEISQACGLQQLFPSGTLYHLHL
jgi:hypothetical protein